MKQCCLHCHRMAEGGPLYCQALDCPAERAPFILETGEWLGDLEIIKRLAILPAAVCYEAMHHQQKVILKVANPGAAATARLQREAAVLAQLGQSPAAFPLLPTLLPPYIHTTLTTDLVGQTVLQKQLFVYLLLQHVPGEPLRNRMHQRPQQWINHVGWLTISLAIAINRLHQQGILHLTLTPDCLLVHFDPQNVPRLLLIDLGMAIDPLGFATVWQPALAATAYLAPELGNTSTHPLPPTFQSDVYGIGLTLYELLVGEPPCTRYPQECNTRLHTALVKPAQAMARIADVKAVARVALQAVAQAADRRQPNAAIVAQQLIALFGPVPPPQGRHLPQTRTLIILASALLFVIFCMVLAVALNSLP